MFGIKLAPGIDLVRILAISGKQGKRPCLWEGSPATPQQEVESAIDSDLRVRRWLTKHRLIKDGVVSLTLSIECYSDGRRVDTVEVKDINLFIRQVKRKPQAASDEVVSRSIQVLDSTIKTLVEQLDRNWKTVHQQLEERDTVIGRLVQRGLEPPVPKQPEPPAPPPTDEFSSLLSKGGQLVQLINMVKSFKGNN